MSATADQHAAAQQGQPPNPDAAGAAGVFSAHELISALLAQERAEVLQVAVGNFDRRQAVLYDWPPGAGGRTKRLIVPRFGLGATGLAVPSATVTEVCEQNEGRLGGLIVNTGTFPCRLYFTTPGDIGGPGNVLSPQATQRPCTWLGASGGSFDFRLGNVLYGGTICAAGVGGATTLDWAEF